MTGSEKRHSSTTMSPGASGHSPSSKMNVAISPGAMTPGPPKLAQLPYAMSGGMSPKPTVNKPVKMPVQVCEPPKVVSEGFQLKQAGEGRWHMPEGTTFEGTRAEAMDYLEEYFPAEYAEFLVEV